jgi:hypothetical protein
VQCRRLQESPAEVAQVRVVHISRRGEREVGISGFLCIQLAETTQGNGGYERRGLVETSGRQTSRFQQGPDGFAALPEKGGKGSQMLALHERHCRQEDTSLERPGAPAANWHEMTNTFL